MSKVKTKLKEKESNKFNYKTCALIQWSKCRIDTDGTLICPQCNRPAELILGFFGQPCYGHKIDEVSDILSSNK
jgi:hypothetical protein